MADATRVNGNQISWSSLRIKINDIPYSGITGIDYTDGRERAYAYGTGRHHAPRGKTAGKYTPEPCVITCWKSTAQAIRKDLAAQAADGVSYGNVVFPIVVQWIEPDDSVITDEILECHLTKNEQSTEEGPEGPNEKLTFMPMRIVRNGLALFDATEGGV